MAIEREVGPSVIPLMPQDPEVEVEVIPDASAVEETGDGGLTVVFGEEPSLNELVPFNANLAEFMEEGELTKLGSDLVQHYEDDRDSRGDWEKAYIKGLDLLGLKFEDRSTPWPGACGVYHPILAEAVVRFQAQTIMETFPASGPVKTQIVGRMTRDKEKQAERVEDELNYQITERMPEYRKEHEQLLFFLPLAGSAFKKVYFDESLGRSTAMFVPAEDFVVQYGASDLQTVPRYTHVMRRYPNEIRKLQVAGFYRDVTIPDPEPESSEIKAKYDKLDGSRPPAYDRDQRHQVLEMYVELDLPGFEDEDEEGNPTGIALPYVVTIEKASRVVLSIRRNWVMDDPKRLRQQYFVHYPFLPGLGFYGSGLIHLIGGIAKSATSIIRQLVDAGTLANLPAGLKARGLRIKGDSTPLMPGEFRDVDIPAGAIKDNITFLPYKEPSAVLFQLLTALTEEGRRLASIADMKIGEQSANTPVGTTLAIMERAMKVMSAVQARIHYAMRQEFKILMGIIRDFEPPQYDYEVEDEGANRQKDFDGRIDVLPVSDPNAATMSQRVVQYQAALQLAQGAPQIYDMPALHRGMLGVLGIEGADQLIPLKDDMKPMDPISENMAILNQKPVKAFLYQDHEAHISVHMAAMQDPKLAGMIGQSPNASTIMGAATAHLQEHLAFQYRREIEKQLGVQLPPPDQPLPEDVEVQLSKVVADAAAKLLQKDLAEQQAQQAQQQMQDPVVQMQMREVEIKAEEVERKKERDDKELELAAREQVLKDERERIRLAQQAQSAGAQLGEKAMKDAADVRLKAAQIRASANRPKPQPKDKSE